MLHCMVVREARTILSRGGKILEDFPKRASMQACPLAVFQHRDPCWRADRPAK